MRGGVSMSLLGRHCSEDDVCDACFEASQPRKPNPETACACCKWNDEGEDVSAADAVINNNGYCPGCRDAECGEQLIGSPCRAEVV